MVEIRSFVITQDMMHCRAKENMVVIGILMGEGVRYYYCILLKTIPRTCISETFLLVWLQDI